MKPYIIGFDTIKMYHRDNLYKHISKVVKLLPWENGYMCHFRNSKIFFSFAHGMTTIRFSIAKIYNGGCNLKLAGLSETRTVLLLVSDLIKLNLREFNISRLHITSNFVTKFGWRRFYKDLKVPAYFKAKTKKNGGFYYHINGSMKRSKRKILFYEKVSKNLGSALFRIELKFEWVEKSGGSMNKLFDRFLNHSNKVLNLNKESFYIECLKYYIKTVGQTLGKKPSSRSEKVIKDELYVGLGKNYYYSYYQLNTKW